MYVIRFILILVFVLSHGCASINLDEIANPEEKRILLLARSNDKFDIVHDGYHFFDLYRPVNTISVEPNWKLRDIFFDVAEKRKSESKFQIVLGKDEYLPPISGLENNSRSISDPNVPYFPYATDAIYKGQEVLLKDLAKKYDADYILLLTGSKFYNQRGRAWLDSEYGYQHIVLKGLINYKAKGQVYMQTHMYLFDPKTIGQAPFISKMCSKYQSPIFYKSVTSLNLPHKIESEFHLNKTIKNDINRLYKEAKVMFENEIVNLFKRCNVIPSPDNYYKDDFKSDSDF